MINEFNDLAESDGAAAAGGYVKCCPPGAIFPRKCGRWHFQNADGRDNAVIPRPMDSILGLHRARLELRFRHNFQQYTKEKFAPMSFMRIFVACPARCDNSNK